MALLPRKVVRQNLGEYSEAFLGFDWSQVGARRELLVCSVAGWWVLDIPQYERQLSSLRKVKPEHEAGIVTIRSVSPAVETREEKRTLQVLHAGGDFVKFLLQSARIAFGRQVAHHRKNACRLAVKCEWPLTHDALADARRSIEKHTACGLGQRYLKHDHSVHKVSR